MAEAQAAPTAEDSHRTVGQDGSPKRVLEIPFRDNVVELLEKLRGGGRKSGGPFAIVFSFEPLSHLERLPAIVADFHKNREKLCALAGGEMIQVGPTDFVLLSDRSDYGVVGAVTDIKMVLLKVIAHHAPDAFAGLDQSRLIRVFDIGRQRGALFKLLEETLRRAAVARPALSSRALSPSDLTLILEKIDALSRQDFVDKFARSQPIALLRPKQTPVVALNEWFVSMSALQEKFLHGTNLQLNQPLFKLLTLELDQRMLDCLIRKHIDPRFSTFNFNIETIFTRKFEELGRAGIVRHLIFEIRASDIFEDFDRFLLATNLISELGGRLALDNVRPSMLPVLRPDRLGCDFIKVFVDELQTATPLFAETIREIQEAGSRIVFARIESLDSVKAGMMLGVDVYQGFYVDTLMKSEEERGHFLVG